MCTFLIPKELPRQRRELKAGELLYAKKQVAQPANPGGKTGGRHFWNILEAWFHEILAATIFPIFGSKLSIPNSYMNTININHSCGVNILYNPPIGSYGVFMLIYIVKDQKVTDFLSLQASISIEKKWWGGGTLGMGAPDHNQPHIHLILRGYLLGIFPFEGLQQGGFFTATTQGAENHFPYDNYVTMSMSLFFTLIFFM